jgi:hypothetical protein
LLEDARESMSLPSMRRAGEERDEAAPKRKPEDKSP